MRISQPDEGQWKANITLSPEQHDALRKAAELEGISLSALVRRELCSYLADCAPEFLEAHAPHLAPRDDLVNA